MSEKRKTQGENQIHDVLILPLEGEDGAIDLFHFGDHLLHRVGLIQHISMNVGDFTSFRLRSRTDEIWCLLDGSCAFVWQDRRESSPTSGTIQSSRPDRPVMVLVPFGVGFGVSAQEDSRLLRIAANDESDVDDQRILNWPLDV